MVQDRRWSWVAGGIVAMGLLSVGLAGSGSAAWAAAPGAPTGSAAGTGQPAEHGEANARRPAETNRAPRQPQAHAPQVHEDRTITFELYAPGSTAAAVEGLPGGPNAMTKGDNGIWSVTVGPLAPEIYTYHFLVDGSMRALDLTNPNIKDMGDNFVLVPASPPAPWEEQPAPRGTVHVLWYPSKTLNTVRRAHVYTPPGYNTSARRRYPVLYLLHGSGDDDFGWDAIGRANVILDNLLAEGRIKPMIVVMPNGQIPGTGRRRGAGRQERIAKFEGDLFNDLMPEVEREYRVKTGPKNTAIAGLSMGAMQSQFVGLQHPERFSAVGLMSGAGIGIDDFDATFPAIAADPTKAQQEFPVIYVSVGKSDALRTQSEHFDAWLTSHGVQHTYHEMDGVHEWKVWRQSLIELAPMLFR